MREDVSGYFHMRHWLHCHTQITDTTSLRLDFMTWLRQMDAANGDLLPDYDINNTRTPAHIPQDDPPRLPAWECDRSSQRAMA